MKTIVISLLSLLTGIVIGWYLGYTMPIVEANREALRQIHLMEGNDREIAVFGIAAIRMIDSGDTQKAMQLLAHPIGMYYRVYALDAVTNKERTGMRAEIEKLAGTDSVVTAEIQKKE